MVKNLDLMEHMEITVYQDRLKFFQSGCLPKSRHHLHGGIIRE